MKYYLALLTLVVCHKLAAISNYAYIYPPVMQSIIHTTFFEGDRHGEFRGDDVAILSDGSAWKIHPDSQALYRTWSGGDRVRAAVRSDWYWLKREHKFLLVNHSRGGESVKAMFIQHKNPALKIVAIDTYNKSYRPAYKPITTVTTNSFGATSTSTSYAFNGWKPSDFRKILTLSDGSTWVIKDNLEEFQMGMNVYVGVQGNPQKFYDFILITGNEREAQWAWARPNK